MATTVERMRRAGGLALVLAAASLGLVATAGAQTDPPPSSVDQYVEMVPTAEGPTAPGTGKRKNAQLPKAGKDALTTVSPEIAGALEEIATSSSYGAPALPQSSAGSDSQAPVREPDTVPETSVESTLASAGAVAVASVSDARLMALLLAVFVTTLGAVALAIARARGGPR
jgi:hypothetical protein